MAHNIYHLRHTKVTVANVALLNRGLYLDCNRCPHRARLTPAALAAQEPPSRTLWDVKRRRRCSKCGAKGSTDDVQLMTFVIDARNPDGTRAADPTAPQLWPA